MIHKKSKFKMKNPAISIIMPAYNVEDYIDKSITSVLKQSMTDFELIIVNDGSTDHTKDIIERYAKNEPNHIRYYSKDNGGLSSARNYGMKVANGEYITFLDSDDYIESDFLENLYSAGQAKESDMILSGQWKVDLQGEKIATISYPVDKIPDFPLRRLNMHGKMYRRAFLEKHQLRFPEGKIYEDNPFNLVAMFLCENMVILPYIGYNQIIHDSTITQHKIKIEQIPFDALENSIKYVLSRPEEINDYSIFEFTVLSFFTYFIFVANKKNMYSKSRQKGRKSDISVIMNICDYVYRVVIQNFDQYWKNIHVGLFKDRELDFSQRAGVWVFVKLCRLHLLKAFAYIYYKL